MRGMEVCRLHGGKSLRGIAHWHYKTGKYAKDLPNQLAGAYEEALSHPEIHTITHEIALGETRLRTLLKRTETSDLGHAWLALSQAWEQFMTARTEGDTLGMKAALTSADTAIARGKTDYLLWQNIMETVKIVADLRLKEHKRLIDLDLVITADRATLLFGLLQNAVRTAVLNYVDPPVARAIFTAIQEDVRGIDTRLVAHPGLSGAHEADDLPLATGSPDA
jgi:hypothetical protein